MEERKKKKYSDLFDDHSLSHTMGMWKSFFHVDDETFLATSLTLLLLLPLLPL